MFPLDKIFTQFSRIPPYARVDEDITRPYNSAAGVPESVGLLVLLASVIFFGYVAYRVNKGLNNTKGKKLPKSRRKKSV